MTSLALKAHSHHLAPRADGSPMVSRGLGSHNALAPRPSSARRISNTFRVTNLPFFVRVQGPGVHKSLISQITHLLSNPARLPCNHAHGSRDCHSLISRDSIGNEVLCNSTPRHELLFLFSCTYIVLHTPNSSQWNRLELCSYSWARDSVFPSPVSGTNRSQSLIFQVLHLLSHPPRLPIALMAPGT